MPNARFYVPGVAQFASADTIVPDPMIPQSFNRYAYTLNNPLKYTDPSGHYVADSSGAFNGCYNLRECQHDITWVDISGGQCGSDCAFSFNSGVAQEYSTLFGLETINITLASAQAEELSSRLREEAAKASYADTKLNEAEMVGINPVDAVVGITLVSGKVFGVAISGMPAQMDEAGSALDDLADSLEIAATEHELVDLDVGYDWFHWGIAVNGEVVARESRLYFNLPITTVNLHLLDMKVLK